MPRVQYNSVALEDVQIRRDEDLVAHNWYRFLLWTLGIGGAAIVIWLFYSGFLLGRRTTPVVPVASPISNLPSVPSPIQKATPPVPVTPRPQHIIRRLSTPAVPTVITIRASGIEQAIKGLASNPSPIVSAGQGQSAPDSAAARARRLEEWSRQP